MSNLALERSLAKLGIPFARSNVGDRYILELLVEKKWHWGGENSGHIICLDKHSTGDGIISALQVLTAMRVNNTTLQEFTSELRLYPQVLINVRTSVPFQLQKFPAVSRAVAEAERDLQDRGRVLLRPSGTEPVLRVMVEGESKAKVEYWADYIATQVRADAS